MENRRLTKSSNKMLGGVCSGVAEFFGLDATLVRVIWAVCVFVGGTGLILYLILWLIMPEGQKESYEKRMQDRLDEMKHKK